MQCTAILLLSALGSSQAAAQAVPALPSGWEQIDTEAYHGPEGYYHDSVSGAVVRYYTGPLPDYIGARPSSGEQCVAQAPQPPPPCLMATAAKGLQVFIGPYGDRMYASYWVLPGPPDQLGRGKALALSNPLSHRLYSGHAMLPRDARESDLEAIAVGMSLVEVLRLLGDPLTVSGSAEGGLQLEFVVWGKWPTATGKLTTASRTVKLNLSRERRLLKKPRGRPTRS